MRSKPIPAGHYGGAPIHPGTILRKDYLAPLGLTAYALAKALHVPQTRLGEILAGRRAISADIALRLARYFGTTPFLWVNLQTAYDLRMAELAHGADIIAEVEVREAVGV